MVLYSHKGNVFQILVKCLRMWVEIFFSLVSKLEIFLLPMHCLYEHIGDDLFLSSHRPSSQRQYNNTI